MNLWPAPEQQPSFGSFDTSQPSIDPDDAIRISPVSSAAAKQIVGSTANMPTGESIIREQGALAQQENNMLRTNQ